MPPPCAELIDFLLRSELMGTHCAIRHTPKKNIPGTTTRECTSSHKEQQAQIDKQDIHFDRRTGCLIRAQRRKQLQLNVIPIVIKLESVNPSGSPPLPWQEQSLRPWNCSTTCAPGTENDHDKVTHRENSDPELNSFLLTPRGRRAQPNSGAKNNGEGLIRLKDVTKLIIKRQCRMNPPGKGASQHSGGVSRMLPTTYAGWVGSSPSLCSTSAAHPRDCFGQQV